MKKKSIPVETERKYLVEMPNLATLRAQPSFAESEIEQIYLPAGAGQTHRIRRRVTNGEAVYTETVKVRVGAISHEEDERVITAEAYQKLAEARDTAYGVIRKRRLVFRYQKQLFEVDVFPFYEKIALCETELEHEEDTAEFPPFLKIIREVSTDGRFSNAALAKGHPDEASLL